MANYLISLLLTSLTLTLVHTEVRPINGDALILGLQKSQFRIFDLRTDYERETEGYIAGSELVSMNGNLEQLEVKYG